MVPPILQRVLKHAGDGLTFEDAILPVGIYSVLRRAQLMDVPQGYTRHCIKSEDYPAVTDVEQSKKLVGDKESAG